MNSTVFLGCQDDANVHWKSIQAEEFLQQLLGNVVCDHVFSCQQIKTFLTSFRSKGSFMGFGDDFVVFLMIPRFFVFDVRVFGLGFDLWRHEISSWRHDIRQSIDRNDCGKNPSFWKLEILVYFLVYFKNWNEVKRGRSVWKQAAEKHTRAQPHRARFFKAN